jgi:uncharacterized Tic20 family protein
MGQANWAHSRSKLVDRQGRAVLNLQFSLLLLVVTVGIGLMLLFLSICGPVTLSGNGNNLWTLILAAMAMGVGLVALLSPILLVMLVWGGARAYQGVSHTYPGPRFL